MTETGATWTPSDEWSDLVPGAEVEEDTRFEASLICATRVSITYARGVKLYVATDPASYTITSSPSSSRGSASSILSPHSSGIESPWIYHDKLGGSDLIAFARARYCNCHKQKAKLKNVVPRIDTSFAAGGTKSQAPSSRKPSRQ